jgi:hypothetical protein
MGAAAHWGMSMPSWRGPVNERGRSGQVFERVFWFLDGENEVARGRHPGFWWGRRGVGARGSEPGSTSESAWGLEEAVGLPTDGLIELEFRRWFEGRFILPSGLTGGLVPVEDICLGWKTGRRNGRREHGNNKTGEDSPVLKMVEQKGFKLWSPHQVWLV